MDNGYERDIQSSLESELELEAEREKLQTTVKLINDEILSYISKRKSFADYIVENRKKAVEEYRDDEDKLIEYFDHERFVKEETFRTFDRRLKELTTLLSAPYFGRVDFKEEDLEAESIYVGRFGMTPEGSYEPVVVDWRAPVAALFYTSKLGPGKYIAPDGDIDVDILRKRQFVIKKGKMQGMFDSALDVKDEILQMVLSKNAGEKLKDIIMTIQEEQDNIIRQPKDKTVLVNGVAGSGKTTIALHRVAYLLYNYRETLQDKVLILGPNNIFMEYIATVLPSLGEVGVRQSTFREFAEGILGIEEVMSFKDYMEKILSGDREFIKDVLFKTSSEYVSRLDSVIENLDKVHFKPKDIFFFDKQLIEVKEIEELFNRYYKDMPLFRRSKKIKRIIFSKLRDYRDELVRGIEKEYKEIISRLSKTELETQGNSIDLARKIRIREVIREVMGIKASMDWLKNPDLIEIYKTMNDNKELTEDDLAPIIYLKTKLEGLRLKEEIKHVVIDEAQDYSAVQFIAIRELTRCNSYTIVGDSNQRIIPAEGEIAMLHLKDILPELNVEEYKLLKSYRSTKQIMSYANKYLGESEIVPLVRSGEEVTLRSFDSDEELTGMLLETIDRLQKKDFESIAVICRDTERALKIGKLLKQNSSVKVVDREDIIYGGGTVVIPSYFAKGLEFDGVIVLDENGAKDNEKLKYVMSTRALHELYVFTPEI